MFVKGKSGNPSGRPKKDPIAHELFSKRVSQAIAAVDACLASDDLELRLRAAEVVFARVWGKPPQAVALTDADGDSLIPRINIVLSATPTRPAIE